MEALDFLKEYNRMCEVTKDCQGCPLKGTTCSIGTELSEEEMINIVEKTEQWSKEHPLVTNSKKFDEVFGKHSMSDLTICEIRPHSHEIIPKKSNWWNEPYEEPDNDT